MRENGGGDTEAMKQINFLKFAAKTRHLWQQLAEDVGD
jgi:hypothetical protein